MQRTDDCKRILGDSRDKDLDGKGLTEKIVRSRSDWSVSGAALNRMNVLVVLRKQIATSSS